MNPLTKAVDAVLAPLNFARRERTWTRTSGAFVDVVDVQVAKGEDAVTSNWGVLDPEIYSLCWGRQPSRIDVAVCTVGGRIGHFIPRGRDIWWPADDDETPELVSEAVSQQVVPFLESMHSRQAMADWLAAHDVVRRKYPPPIIYLAILRHLDGDAVEACSLLTDLRQKAIGAWQSRVIEISADLGCS